MDKTPLFAVGLSIRSGLKAGKITVYGKDTCPWTVKQLEYLDKHKQKYTYVNCATGTCPDFVKGYPTLDINGQILEGFQKL